MDDWSKPTMYATIKKISFRGKKSFGVVLLLLPHNNSKAYDVVGQSTW